MTSPPFGQFDEGRPWRIGSTSIDIPINPQTLHPPTRIPPQPTVLERLLAPIAIDHHANRESRLVIKVFERSREEE
jgi:hypothetical protein